MSSITQENRSISIGDFSLGEDTFILTAFSGSEFVSNLFEFRIEVISEVLDIKPDSVVGKATTVTVQNEHERVFNGYIKDFSVGEVKSHGLRSYKMTMVPWLWFLSQTNNHRIFQNKNTKDIVSQIFQDLDFSDFEFRAAGGSVREYCIQHNESDLHFVSRLLEEEGIAYYFTHEKSKHQLTLVDQKNAYDECGETDLEYSNGTSPGAQITRWEHLHNFKKGQWSLSDYNFKEPTKKLFSNTKTTSKFANNDKYEHYEYPGMYDAALGNDLVKIRLDAEEAGINTVLGTSDCSTFYAGGRFKVDKHESASEKGDFILVRVDHDMHDSSHVSGKKQSSGYSNAFVCIPANVHFRPQLEHAKPVMRGPQSAIVTGPSGEEIYVDDLGRVKCQFYWDREGKNDENTTCFIRVMQQWAGAQWGASFIPRIGHEVIVDFIDGDPDRPIITGTVYNGKNKPPFDSKTQSGWRTRSSKSGTAANANELRFDDKKDAEQIYIHAEKNMDTEVENDETHTVDNDRTKHIKHDENSDIDNDRNKTVGNNQTETIVKNKTISVGENHDETIGKNNTISVGKDHTETIGKNASIDIAHNETLNIGKNVTIGIGENHDESVGKNMTISVGGNLTEEVSGQYREAVTKEYRLTAKKIAMEADQEILFKTGSAKILMKSNGDITISGKNITVKGSGNVVVKGSQVKVN
ncbi:MAG: type VI secretion system secreted protein VgrG [Lentisphaeria bacterium]|jgi:type VI secretion system secreted protein VgrG